MAVTNPEIRVRFSVGDIRVLDRGNVERMYESGKRFFSQASGTQRFFLPDSPSVLTTTQDQFRKIGDDQGYLKSARLLLRGEFNNPLSQNGSSYSLEFQMLDQLRKFRDFTVILNYFNTGDKRLFDQYDAEDKKTRKAARDSYLNGKTEDATTHFGNYVVNFAQFNEFKMHKQYERVLNLIRGARVGKKHIEVFVRAHPQLTATQSRLEDELSVRSSSFEVTQERDRGTTDDLYEDLLNSLIAGDEVHPPSYSQSLHFLTAYVLREPLRRIGVDEATTHMFERRIIEKATDSNLINLAATFQAGSRKSSFDHENNFLSTILNSNEMADIGKKEQIYLKDPNNQAFT